MRVRVLWQTLFFSCRFKRRRAALSMSERIQDAMSDDRVVNSQEKPNAAEFAGNRDEALSKVTLKNRDRSNQRLTPVLSAKAVLAQEATPTPDRADNVMPSVEAETEASPPPPQPVSNVAPSLDWPICMFGILVSFFLGMFVQYRRQRQ